VKLDGRFNFAGIDATGASFVHTTYIRINTIKLKSDDVKLYIYVQKSHGNFLSFIDLADLFKKEDLSLRIQSFPNCDKKCDICLIRSFCAI